VYLTLDTISSPKVVTQLSKPNKDLSEAHAGICGHHVAPRALISKVFRQGFDWLIVVTDAQQIIQSCEGCQFYVRQTHLPLQDVVEPPK
jgi:hypothetical protein